MMWNRLRNPRTVHRIAAVDELQFPAGGRQRLANQHPHLSGDDILLVEAATRQWFRLVARYPRAALSVPSVVVNDLWQEMALHEHDYAVFCDAAFGRFLPYQRGSGDMVRRSLLTVTLGYARRDEDCGPTALPLLFRVDTALGIRDGNRYLADCGGRGECFEAAGSQTCLQHLAGPGKRPPAGGGIRGDLPFNDGRHGGGYVGTGYGTADGGFGGGDGGGGDGGGGGD